MVVYDLPIAICVFDYAFFLYFSWRRLFLTILVSYGSRIFVIGPFTVKSYSKFTVFKLFLQKFDKWIGRVSRVSTDSFFSGKISSSTWCFFLHPLVNESVWIL